MHGQGGMAANSGNLRRPAWARPFLSYVLTQAFGSTAHKRILLVRCCHQTTVHMPYALLSDTLSRREWT